MKRAGFRALMAALAIGAAGPARAIVGGRDETGPLARTTLMVLSSRGGMCSGVVVAPDAVLTAAHCVTAASDYRVHFRGADGAPVLLEPAALAVHPGYDRGAIAGRRRSIDLALVRVAAPLPFGSAILGSEAGPKGATVAFAGYGVAREGDARSTGTLRSVDLAIVEPYGRSKILVWAQATDRARGACEGDSGGPVADGSGTVLAITTWATGAGRRTCGDLSQAVLLGPQRHWIDATLAGWKREAAWR